MMGFPPLLRCASRSLVSLSRPPLARKNDGDGCLGSPPQVAERNPGGHPILFERVWTGFRSLTETGNAAHESECTAKLLASGDPPVGRQHPDCPCASNWGSSCRGGQKDGRQGEVHENA